MSFAAPAQARSTHVRTRTHAHLRGTARPHLALVASPVLTPGSMLTADAATPVPGRPYSLRLHALHTEESIQLVYRIGDTYIPAAVESLNKFLRDHRTDEATHYDPTEFDLLHNLLGRLGRTDGVIDIVCGYRAPETNALLRNNNPSTGVAEHSQHILGHAIDIRVPGVPTARLRAAALSLEAGGVGYYPQSQFVHVDVGPVREWTFGGGGGRRRGRKHRRA